MIRAAEALPIPDGWYAPGFDDSSWPPKWQPRSDNFPESHRHFAASIDAAIAMIRSVIDKTSISLLEYNPASAKAIS